MSDADRPAPDPPKRSDDAARPFAQPLGSFRAPADGDAARAPARARTDPPRGNGEQEREKDAFYRPSRLATASTALLWLALFVSVGLHTGLVVAAADRTFGFVNLDDVDQPPRVIRLKRAAFDTVLPADARVGPGAAPAEPDTPAVFDDLLANQPAEALDDRPDLGLRPLDDARPAEAVTDLAVALPAFEIDPALLETLDTTAPAEAEVVTGTGLAGRADAPATDPDLTAALLATSVGSSARSAARPGGAAGAGGAPGIGSGGVTLPGTTARHLDQRPAEPPPTTTPRGPADVRPAVAPPAGPDIDYAALALAGTTELIFPEHLDDDFRYELFVHHDRNRPADPAYFRVEITPRDSLRKLKTLPKDLVFLIDTSSSIPQSWVEQIALGVEQSLAGMNPQDRFNLVVFNDTVRFLSDQPVQASEQNLAAARTFLRDAKSKGYTDVNAALRRLLRRDQPPGRVYTLVLISDGKPTVGVVDARQLINLITRENDRVAGIYCVGAAPQKDLDPRLLDFLSYRNNGFSVFAYERDQVAETIRNLASQLRYPLITDVTVRVAGDHVRQVQPQRLPTIHQGQGFSVYGRYTEERPLTVQITGKAENGRPVDFTFTRRPADAPQAGPDVASQWAFWALHELYGEVLDRGENPTLLREIAKLRDRYGLQTLY